MASTNDILNTIIERLKNEITDLAVERYPDKMDSTTYQLIHPVGILLVGYKKSKYRRTSDMAMMAQTRSFRGFVSILTKKLNGRKETYNIVDRVRAALIGYSPTDCEPIWLDKDICAEDISDLWQHVIDFRCHTLCQQQIGADTHLFTEINHEYTE